MPIRRDDTTSFGGAGTSRFRLVRKLGEGGFGDVWLAEQTEPLKRKVALKILKKGMDTEAIVQRFLGEQTALNRLNHPSLAKVFDTGTTPEGLPFFAMEYVEGRPIDTYADEQNLSIRTRVELLIQVAEAVHHAHTKGLIHRDLKPENILVGKEGTTSFRAKVIDFGIAKVIQSGDESGSRTLVGQVIGSPDYMSPEQASALDDIDTRTDIWALGVILYEVVTGSLPFSRGLFRTAGTDEWRRTLREVTPQTPSTRIRTGGGGTSGTSIHELALKRAADSRTLISTVHGDLDWIIMRCLEKERDRRYASAADLAEELRRYLRGDAVLAGPPTIRYRAGKLLQRYKLAAGLGLGMVVLLISASIVSTTLWWRSERALAQSRATLDTIVASLQSATLEEGGSPSQSFPTFLSSLEAQAESLAQHEPLVAASMLHSVGTLRLAGQDWPGAERALGRTVELRRADQPALTQDRSLAAQSLHDHARALFFLKRYPDSRARYESALELWDSSSEAAQRSETLRHLGSVYGELQLKQESEDAFTRALDLTLAIFGADSLEAVTSYYSRARQRLREGRTDEGEADLLKGLSILQARVKEPDFRIGSHLQYIAGIQAERGLVEKAAGTYLAAIENLSVLQADHSRLVSVRLDAARILLTCGRAEEALAQASEALAARRRTAAAPAKIVEALDVAARAAAAAGDSGLARRHLNDALHLQRDSAPGGSLLAGDLALRLAEQLIMSGRELDLASRLLNEAGEEAQLAGPDKGAALAARVTAVRAQLSSSTTRE